MSDSLWPRGLQHTRPPHHLLEFAQVHVHRIGYAIQPSHPLSPSSPSALNLSQQQDLFQWVGFSYQVATILEFQLQLQFLQWKFRIDFLYSFNSSNENSGLISFNIIGLISLLSKGLSRVFPSTTIWKHQFFSTLPSLWSSSHIHTWLLEKP